VLLAALGVIGVIWISASAHAATTGQLQQQISAGQGKISSLSSAVGAASHHLAQLNSSIASLQGQISRIQADLDAKRLELLKLRSELDAARTRLGQLQAFEARGERVLSAQLLSAYEHDRPDIVSVVLEARGFTDLLERLTFAQRVRDDNVAVVNRVRSERQAVAAQAIRLGALQARQEAITLHVLRQRNTLARAQVSLVQQQISVAQNRNAKASQLANARGHVAGLRHALARLQAAAAAAAAQNASSGSGGGATAPNTGGSSVGQVVSGGGFTFPLPKGAASPPGTWSLDQGVDISAPGDTPEVAVCSGTIVLHGIGGFGPWAPVLHCDSPVGGYSYVYYGHAGPANQLAVGTHVGAGQVISEVGPGIVGISTGPHLEIGFCDGSGGPIGAGSASTMMSLLQGAYG
jgi:murein DD-endopeptidase MepM/ murein hydrolase activator NlpD